MGIFGSSIGRKYLMGATGLALSLFVFSHVMGNFLIFCGAESYNKYSHALISNPFIYVIEIGLLVVFLVHVIIGILLTRENRRARPTPYKMQASGEKSANLASRSMIYHGVVLLLFSVYHLITFKFGPTYWVTYNGVEMRDLFKLVIDVFHNPLYVGGYVACMALLGFHLSHGFSSSFQSLGFNHPRYTPWIKKTGLIFGFLIALGFMSQPIYVFLWG